MRTSNQILVLGEGRQCEHPIVVNVLLFVKFVVFVGCLQELLLRENVRVVPVFALLHRGWSQRDLGLLLGGCMGRERGLRRIFIKVEIRHPC